MRKDSFSLKTRVYCSWWSPQGAEAVVFLSYFYLVSFVLRRFMVEASVRPGGCAVQREWIGWTKRNDCLAGFENAVARLLEILLSVVQKSLSAL